MRAHLQGPCKKAPLFGPAICCNNKLAVRHQILWQAVTVKEGQPRVDAKLRYGDSLVLFSMLLVPDTTSCINRDGAFTSGFALSARRGRAKKHPMNLLDLRHQEVEQNNKASIAYCMFLSCTCWVSEWVFPEMSPLASTGTFFRGEASTHQLARTFSSPAI